MLFFIYDASNIPYLKKKYFVKLTQRFNNLKKKKKTKNEKIS